MTTMRHSPAPASVAEERQAEERQDVGQEPEPLDVRAELARLDRLAVETPSRLPRELVCFAARILEPLSPCFTPEVREAWGRLFSVMAPSPRPIPAEPVQPTAGPCAPQEDLAASERDLQRRLGPDPAPHPRRSQIQGLGALIDQIERVREVIRSGAELPPSDLGALHNVGEILIDFAARERGQDLPSRPALTPRECRSARFAILRSMWTEGGVCRSCGCRAAVEEGGKAAHRDDCDAKIALAALDRLQGKRGTPELEIAAQRGRDPASVEAPADPLPEAPALAMVKMRAGWREAWAAAGLPPLPPERSLQAELELIEQLGEGAQAELEQLAAEGPPAPLTPRQEAVLSTLTPREREVLQARFAQAAAAAGERGQEAVQELLERLAAGPGPEGQG